MAILDKDGNKVIVYHAEGGLSQTDILIPPPVSQIGGETQNRGNVYINYDNIIECIYKLYNNQVRYGCGITKSIIDWRATQIAGNGVNVKSSDKATNDFLREWVRDNNLDGSRFWRWARDGEIEGKALLINRVKTINGKKKIQCTNIPWMRFKYHLESDEFDGETPSKASFTDSEGKEVRYASGKFAFAKLGGTTVSDRGYLINNTPPRISAVLWHIENIDRALSDLRSNNHLFAAPIRVAEAQSDQEANVLRNALFGRSTIGQTRVKMESDIGEFYVINGKMYYAEPSGSAIESLKNEITLAAQIVSGETGIPVHYLGFPDLMSNRATAEDMHEMVAGTTTYEREAWKNAIRDLAIQACELAGLQFDPSTIEVSIPVVMLSQMKAVAEQWLNLYKEGVITLETLVERIPGIDPELELRRLKKQEKKKQQESADMAAVMLEQMKNQPEDSEDESNPEM